MSFYEEKKSFDFTCMVVPIVHIIDKQERQATSRHNSSHASLRTKHDSEHFWSHLSNIYMEATLTGPAF